MLRADFDRNLKTLEDDLISPGNMVDKVITKSLIGLKNRDLHRSRQMLEEDDYIDQ
jgi:hypothetical protein